MSNGIAGIVRGGACEIHPCERGRRARRCRSRGRFRRKRGRRKGSLRCRKWAENWQGMGVARSANSRQASCKPAKNSAENGPNPDKSTRNHRIPAKRANSLLKYSALWIQPCCRRPASPRRRRAIDAERLERDIEKRHGEDN